MSRRGPLWFDAIRLLLWGGGILLFFRAMTFAIAFLGGDIRDFWVVIAGASTVFIVFWGFLLLRWHFPGFTESESFALPVVSDDANRKNTVTITKDGTTMPDKPHIYIDKVMNVNHGTINQNTPGGMMNLGPVTVNQSFATPQDAPESVQDEPKETAAEIIGDEETIDINALVELSARLQSPGVARNTIDNILKKAGIKPCKTEKDGRNIRYLYPRNESQAAVASYLADRNK